MKEERHISALLGYYELGMMDESLEELSHLSPDKRADPHVLQLEAAIHIRAGHFDRGLETADKLCFIVPESPAGWLDRAFCLHELDRTLEAKACLLTGPASLRGHALYYYNLACYEAQLGNVEAARSYLEKAVLMEVRFQEASRRDPDLKPLFSSLD
ncbi:MAG: tetratricopeptide repeat protein [Candidatus Methylacidiphilales bacterium]